MQETEGSPIPPSMFMCSSLTASNTTCHGQDHQSPSPQFPNKYHHSIVRSSTPHIALGLKHTGTTIESPDSASTVVRGNLLDGPAITNATDSTATTHRSESTVTRKKPGRNSAKRANHRSKSASSCLPTTILSNWWWEATCCALVVLAFISLVSTLRAYDKHPVPDFPGGVTFNTIISIYSALIRAAAGLVAAEGLSHLKWVWFAKDQCPLNDISVFDCASRGPWGALCLMCLLRWHDLVAWSGAAVTVMLLALDPFTQQIIRRPPCTRPAVGAIANIMRTQYSANHDPFKSLSTLDIQIAYQAYIYRAALGLSTNQELHDCASGQCIFDEYSTLAWTSSCTNVTEQLEETRGRVVAPDAYGTLGTSQTRDFKLPGCKDSERNPVLRRFDDRSAARPEASQDLVVGACDYNLNWVVWNDTFGASAYRCYLRPCIQTLKAQINQGFLIETIISQVDIATNTTAEPWYFTFSAVDLQYLDDPVVQRLGLVNMGYQLDADSRFLPYDIAFEIPDNQPRFNVDPVQANCSPSMTCPQPFRAAEGTSMNSNGPCYNLNNCTTAENNYSLPAGSYVSPWALNLIPATSLYQAFPPYDILQMFAGNMSYPNPSDAGVAFDAFARRAYIESTYIEDGNVKIVPGSFSKAEEFMRNISDAMSVYMRVHGHPNYSAPARGIVLEDTTCVHVSWPWVTYSTIIVSLLLFFLTATIWQGRRAQQHMQDEWGEERDCSFDFKSSALDLLYHGLDRVTLQECREATFCNSRKAGKEEAKIVKARLVPTDEGLRLSSQAD